MFDPDRYRWRDAGWTGVRLLGGCLYEVHVGTFTRAGTLDAAADRLDHLVRLGVDAVQLMPLGVAPGLPGWGYESALPDAVRAEYGGPRALQRFVDACHGRGLAVVLDVVHNHLGPAGAPHKHLAPYFDPGRRTPWGKAMDLAAPRVRAWLVDSAVGWLRDFHLDGLRLDAVQHLDGGDRPVVAELADRVAALAAATWPRTLLGEVRPPRPQATDPDGLGLDAAWDWGPGTALARLADERLPRPARAAALAELAAGYDTYGPATVTARLDHDIVGNTPTGTRPGPAAAFAAAIALTLPTTALLFMGEEWAATSPFGYFVGFDDAALLGSIRAGRRAQLDRYGAAGPMADPGDPATRAAAILDWTEPHRRPHRDVLRLYRALLRLRRCGSWRPVHADAGKLLLVLDGPARLAVNAGPAPVRPPGADRDVPARSAVLLGPTDPDPVAAPGLVAGVDRGPVAR